MATSTKDTARVTLPGRMFKKAGRWWWRVQLPGEARGRARALRGPHERTATRDRSTAEAAALGLWEAAIVRETQARILAAVKTQSLEKSRAYAFLIDQMTERQALSFRQAPWTAPSASDMQDVEAEPAPSPVVQAPIEALSTGPAPPSTDLTALLTSDAGCEQTLDLTDFLSESAGLQERQGCECCGSKDFFDEYLQTVESGQKLCPRCVQALRDDVRSAASREVTAV
jgi:hypothetical protein